MKDKNIALGRSYYYEFFAIPFFFSEKDEKFSLWKKQLDYLKNSPIANENLDDFKALSEFSFDEFKAEQNRLLYDYSYSNIPLTASFYKEGRDEGLAKKLVLDTLRKSKFRKNSELCKDSEDFIGFIFYLMSSLLKDEVNTNAFLSTELFVNVINEFIDEFINFIKESKESNFYLHLANLMQNFFELERSILAVEKPKIKPSVAKEMIEKQPYLSNLKTTKEKFDWDE
ncbi:molecular chaperone TorD family protein [Campylobacter ureolyticus]|uniref:molecular chaperone TorD family protein n=1 Tax=Campylobacter ureolyticus TaxID=827 RepID=UPI00288A80ED|nr:molecular chaperone TorD family protein [Campylobacter ureolyticus]